ncbi:MAG: cell wall hydrolase [Novosphingobium sp.]
MDDLLNRRMTVFLLAFLPLVLLAWASLRFDPLAAAVEAAMPDNPQILSQLAQLPGSPLALPPPGDAAPLIPPADARAQNAADPFFAGKLDPAMPYRLRGTPADMLNARDCLALAAMAEAGGSDPGQRAVIQVILNRVRHPAFASTVCGVVFEGSERATGCQFTFTCDGSLVREYDPAAWSAARLRAQQALAGYVYAPVGNATHYHTDWVYPWWSGKLEKIAQVETHLFFRWPGYWGSMKAWRRSYGGNEPSLAELIARQRAAAPTPALGDLPATNLEGIVSVVMPPLPADTPKVSGGEVVMRLPSGKANFVTVAPAAGTDSALALARKLCPAEGTCRVMGWSDRALIPASLPLPAASRAGLEFSYSRDPAGAEIALFNCDSFPGQPREKCIPRAR